MNLFDLYSSVTWKGKRKERQSVQKKRQTVRRGKGACQWRYHREGEELLGPEAEPL